MLYYDGSYNKWTAAVDHDNPFYSNGLNYKLLNRTEGYKVLYFINHLESKHWSSSPETATYQKIEKLIRYDVPTDSRSCKRVAVSLVANWSKV